MSYSEVNYFVTQWGTLPCRAAAGLAAPQAVFGFKTLLTPSEMCSRTQKCLGADTEGCGPQQRGVPQKDPHLHFNFFLIRWWAD